MLGETAHDPIEIRKHLKQIVESDKFAGAHRLQEFLTYVVEEKLAGRGDGIMGKTIAADIYGRGPEVGPENKSVVRVDAGRLRRRLDSYYQSADGQFPVRIEMPVGSYVPRFIVELETDKATRKPSLTTIVIAVLGVAVILLLTTVGLLVFPPPMQDEKLESALESATRPESESTLKAKRLAMYAKSPASLQAYEFSAQARKLIFPPTDRVRQNSALKLFKNAIAHDDGYYGGYAGAAQVYAFMAFLRGADQSGELLKNAATMARKAQELAPTEAWVQTTLAWVAFVSGDFDQADILADQAAILDPNDAHNLDFHGMIAGFGGKFEKAIDIVSPRLNQSNPAEFIIHQNILAVANYHLGDYRETINQINQIIERGGASNPLMTTYLIAAHQALGENAKARQLLKSQRAAWPKFKPEIFVRRIFSHQEHANQIIERLREIGG